MKDQKDLKILNEFVVSGILLSYALYKHLSGKANRYCKVRTGINKQICIYTYKIRALKEQIQFLKKRQKQCKSDKCQFLFDKRIDKLNKNLNTYNNRFDKLSLRKKRYGQ